MDTINFNIIVSFKEKKSTLFEDCNDFEIDPSGRNYLLVKREYLIEKGNIKEKRTVMGAIPTDNVIRIIKVEK